MGNLQKMLVISRILGIYFYAYKINLIGNITYPSL